MDRLLEIVLSSGNVALALAVCVCIWLMKQLASERERCSENARLSQDVMLRHIEAMATLSSTLAEIRGVLGSRRPG